MKHSINDLAIFGGEPAFPEPLHVGRPNIGNRQRFLERVNGILDRNYLTNGGPYVKEFESQISEMIGVNHSIATCNGTMALELAIRALGLTGEVIIPSFTFIATAHSLQWQAITPVFCDIDPETHTIDPTKIEQLITPYTTGIIGVHLWGRACNVVALTEIARKHNLKLLFDASHAFGCSYRGRPIGSFGDAEIFSFHATKFVNAFEGGAIVTNNTHLASKIRLMKNFGFTGTDEVGYVGVNGKMTEVSAAMGLTSMESMDEFVFANYQNYKKYQLEFHDIAGIRLLTFNEGEQTNYQYIVVEIDESVSQIGRDELIQVLRAEHVMARRYFYPGCHNMEPYRSYFPQAKLWLPNTESIVRKIISLPTGTSINEVHIEKICKLIRYTIDQGRHIASRIHANTIGAALGRISNPQRKSSLNPIGLSK